MKPKAKKAARPRARKHAVMKQNKTRLIALLVVLLVVATFVLLFFYRQQFQKPEAPSAGNKGPVATEAPKGEVVPGFPKESLLDAKSSVDKSYAVDYGGGIVQRTTDFSSAKLMLDLFAEYKDYFSKNGWTVTNEITKYKASRGIYAVNASTSEEASVAIMDKGKTREVTVSYLQK